MRIRDGQRFRNQAANYPPDAMEAWRCRHFGWGGEIRGYVLKPNRGRNQEMERSTAQMPEMRLGLEKEGSSKTRS